jgi:hypothetical protein
LLSFCLRAYDLISIGFSLPGIALSRRMYSIARKYGHGGRQAELANLLCSAFAVLHRRLEAIASDLVIIVSSRLLYQ